MKRLDGSSEIHVLRGTHSLKCLSCKIETEPGCMCKKK
jgi:DTW domain-containing protein YfiP